MKNNANKPDIVGDLIATFFANRMLKRMGAPRIKRQRPVYESNVRASAHQGRRTDSVRTNLVSRKRNWPAILTVSALILLVLMYVLPEQAQQPAAAVSDIKPISYNVTPTGTVGTVGDSTTMLPHGTCLVSEPFMNMYDQVDNTGTRGIGVIVFDWSKNMRLCIPEWKAFKELVANGLTGDALLNDQRFVDYTGKLAFRGAAAFGIPDNDDIARQGLRHAVSIALQAALESPQPADDPSGQYTHGYIIMPGDTLIAAATEAFKKDVDAKKAALAKIPSANNKDVYSAKAYTRDVVERQVRENCKALNVPDVEACVKAVTDQFMAKLNNEQTPDTMKALLAAYMATPTPNILYLPGTSPYAELEGKIREGCATTANPEMCEAAAKKAYDEARNGDLAAALQVGVAAGNDTCTRIAEVSFADLANHNEIWSVVRQLHVWRITNDNQGDTTTLTGVGVVNGKPAICIGKITNAPVHVAGGEWATRSDNIMNSAAQYSTDYASQNPAINGGGLAMTGGIISKSNIYPSDVGGGVYHVVLDATTDNQLARYVFEIPISGLYVSPVTGVQQIQPTLEPSVTPLPAPIQNLIVITSTPGPRPTPTGLTINDLANWASGQGYTMFMLHYVCSGPNDTPPNPVLVDDGRFSATVNWTGVNAACSVEHAGAYWFVISTDNMLGQAGWTNVGGLWVSTK